MKEIISGTKIRKKEIDSSVKENIKFKQPLTQHIQEICHIMKREILRMIDIVREGSEPQNLENIFYRIIDNFPDLK